jgi:ATP-dependent helicase HepA
MEKFIPGQRWVSDSEPELGLGLVLEAAFRQVKIHFAAAEETRVYRVPGAPLRRARLAPGDRARARSGSVLVVERVEERDGLLTYHGGGVALPEGELLDGMSFSDPEKRLMAGQAGKPRAFDLRVRTLELQRTMMGSRVRGLSGARMELLPHQIAIAHEVASRHNPRVLLADEVGLGKTIEAGLVFQRLYATGQISRVVIAAPSQLVHQWMVELYRRFHHLFTVLDEEFCRAEEKGDATKNPFALRSLILCPVDFLAAPGSGAKRVQQAVDAGIDLLIVDEAHHLQWSEAKASPEYTAAEALARAARGVLLLTATPIQLGQAGHFGRLRLLDPDRFTNLQAYLAETSQYEELARLADALLSSEKPEPSVAQGLRALYPHDDALATHLTDYLAGAAGSAGFLEERARLVDDLIDRHGTGRLMFRNRRQAMGGFPGRVVYPVPLEAKPFIGDAMGQFGSKNHTPLQARDPRMAWLVRFLSENPDDKVLLITSRKEDVFVLQELLPTLTTALFTSFHENLTMTTRDKNAAWFAQPEGARLLICSEIGSEGRNFQFAKHLVLFDLPADPGVLEQRIGRLDRIGRKGEVHIHVPYVQGTAHEVLFRWYHEGFDAFRNTVLGADAFHELLRADLEAAVAALNASGATAAVEALITKTRETAAHVRETLEKGRDRLLEIHGNRTALAEDLIAEMNDADEDPELEIYLDEVFDHFGLDAQDTVVTRGHLVLPGERMVLDAFPGIPEEGLPLTYDRREALAREEMAFISPDHPLVRTAVDLVLEDEDGRSVFVAWPDQPEGVRRGFALEAVFVLAATSPGSLHLDRFLPPTPVRVMVDGEGESLGGLLPLLDAVGADLEAAPTGLLEEHHTLFEPMIPALLEAARTQAGFKVSQLKREAHKEAETRLQGEADRLRALSAVNPAVTKDEVAAAERHARAVMEHITSAELRLDSVRFVMMGDMEL